MATADVKALRRKVEGLARKQAGAVRAAAERAKAAAELTDQLEAARGELASAEAADNGAGEPVKKAAKAGKGGGAE